jgi:hypothetical protein
MREMDARKLRQMEHAGREIAAVLQGAIRHYESLGGEKWGFALMLFSFDGPEFSWISNAERADMVRAMQEFINRNPPDQTSEERN